MNEEILLIQLRDCFTAGYTMPQFCIDNGIKKPLFVALDERHATFMWEIYVQFKFDKRINPRFTLLNGKAGRLDFSVNAVLNGMIFEHFQLVNLMEHDLIIFLTAQRCTPAIPKSIYLDELSKHFTLKTYAEIPLAHFLQSNPKVKLIVTNAPQLNKNDAETDFERKIFEDNETIVDIRRRILSSNGEKVVTPYDRFGYSNREVCEMLELAGSKNNLDGSTILESTTESDLVKIHNGKRMTAYQPEIFKNRIFFIGTCPYFGIGAPFDKTIESHLQKLLNENNLPYRVENESQFFNGRQQDIFYNLSNLQVNEGDIIFLCLQTLLPLNVPSIDLRDMFKRPHNYGEVFTDVSHHLNEVGYRVWAEKFFYLLIQHNFFKDVDFNYPPPTYASASLRHSA